MILEKILNVNSIINFSLSFFLKRLNISQINQNLLVPIGNNLLDKEKEKSLSQNSNVLCYNRIQTHVQYTPHRSHSSLSLMFFFLIYIKLLNFFYLLVYLQPSLNTLKGLPIGYSYVSVRKQELELSSSKLYKTC